MPSRPGLATRRFYRTFYQWTLLTTETIPTAGQRAFHTTPRARDKSHETDRAVIRKYRSRNRSRTPILRWGGAKSLGSRNGAGEEARRDNPGIGAGDGSAPALALDAGSRHIALQKTPNSSTPSPPRLFTKSPVLSPSQKPFGSLKPHEQVVRYRSPDSIMIEVAIPENVLHRARIQWGDSLESISKRSEARIEVQNVSAPFGDRPDDRIHSVLISGTFAQVASAGDFLGSVPVISTKIIQSQEEVPSHTLPPWQMVLRGREQSHDTVELSVLEEDWISAARLNNWGRVAMSVGTALEVGLLDSRPTHVRSHENAPARSLLLNGPSRSVERFRDILAYRIQKVRESTNVGQAAAPSKYRSPLQKQLLKCVVRIEGKTARLPSFVDAVWRSIEQPRPLVRVFRNTIPEGPTDGQWLIEVLGPASDAITVQAQIEAVARDIDSRTMQGVLISGTMTDRYKYMLTLTGKHAVPMGRKISARMSSLNRVEQIDLDYSNSPPPLSAEQWQMIVKVQPKFKDYVHKQILKFAQEIAQQEGATDVEISMALDTLDIELGAPPERPAALNIARVDPKSNTPPVGAAIEDGAYQQAKIVRTAIKQAANSEHTSYAPSSRAGSSTPMATSQSDQPDGGKVRFIQDQRPRVGPEQRSQIKEDVRTSLRSLTHPVVLITSRVIEIPEGVTREESARGVTVSSFNTVALDPYPVVSFNLKVPSRSWDAICQSRKLRIHLLEASSRGAAVAQIFTKPYDQPEMGFEELRKLGVEVRITHTNQAPILSDVAILTSFDADLLREKCVVVGDHVVVLAGVTSVDMQTKGYDVSDGLAYATRGYRARGVEILPEALPLATEGGPNDPLLLATEEPSTRSYPPSRESIDWEDTSDPHAFFNIGNDPIYSALRATKDAAESGQDADVYAAMAIENEEFDDEKLPWESETSRFSPNSNAAMRASRYGIKDQHTGESQSNQYKAVVRPLLGESLKRPRQVAVTPMINGRLGDSFSQLLSFSTKRALFTLAGIHNASRSFSCSAMAYGKDGEGSYELSPATKATTVADFFGVPDDNKRPHFPRVRSLVRFQKEIRLAERRLENKELSEEETAALQSTIASRERKIARKLAWNAAGELRLMLDKGNARVDFKRAQWLESAVEKGLKLLLDDARNLRQKREEGTVDAAQYDMLRQKLESDHGALQTELMRLREVADEDQDGGD